jgi:hypothetical protein
MAVPLIRFAMRHRLVLLRYPVVLAFAAAPLIAQPDHSVNQRTDVPLVPATEAAPGASQVSITIEGDRRVVVSNGLPDHPTGRFPNSGNPNRIVEQHYRFTMPANPVANPTATPLQNQPFGIAVNGVLFDPGTAEFWQDDGGSGWHYDANGDAFSLGLDSNDAHVQPNGAYHYHGIPIDLLARLSGGKPAMTLLGWAADGFPIYGVWGYRSAMDSASGLITLRPSYRLKRGLRPSDNGQPGGTYDGSFVEDFEYVAASGDLDECNGRLGVTPEFPKGTYYYVLAADFPFTPRELRGTPDASFERRGGPRGRRGPPPPWPPQ